MAAVFLPAATTLRLLNSRVSAVTLTSLIHSLNLTHILFSSTTNSAVSRLRHRGRFCSVVASSISSPKSEPLKFERIREFRKKFKIVDIKAGPDEGLNKWGETVVVRGWVRTLRVQSSVTFIEVNDGSCLSNMQCVTSYDTEGYDQGENGVISTGASVWIQGTIVGSQGSKQKVELKVEKLVTVGESDPSFPIQKKRVSREFLRTKAHLRPRTNTFGAVSRVRNALAFATQFFSRQ